MRLIMRHIAGIIGCAAWIMLTGQAQVQSAILPIEGDAGITINLLQNGQDKTTDWLPVPGQSVEIQAKLNGVPANVEMLQIVCPTGQLGDINTPCPTPGPGTVAPPNATSNFPGICTNYGSKNDLSPDYEINGTSLIPTDCGGRAVVQVTVTDASGASLRATFRLPLDADNNGLPDYWESLSGSGTLDPNADADDDNIATIDEYRGFRVSGTFIRTNPSRKDTFVHLVNPQCLTAGDNTNPQASTESLLGLGIDEPTGRKIYPAADAGGLFDNLATLGSSIDFHFLGYMPGRTNYTTDEWVDRFVSSSLQAGSVYRDAAGNLTGMPPLDDRQINVNALSPVLDLVTGPIQKGNRVVECVTDTGVSPLGIASWGTPNAWGDVNAAPDVRAASADNSIIFTRRIVKYFISEDDLNRDGLPDGLILAGAPRIIAYSTFEGGVWSPPTNIGAFDDQRTQDFIISKGIQFYLSMELGHDFHLLPEENVVQKTSYGFHTAPFSGDNLDQTITNKIARKTTGSNTFYIPSIYFSSDIANFRTH